MPDRPTSDPPSPPHAPAPHDTTGAVPALPVPPAPEFRRLRIFAFDPSLDLALDTRVINQAIAHVPWEKDGSASPESVADGTNSVQPGPVGEYLEVVDVDPPSGMYYPPVDLNHRHVLAQDGLPPSEGNPQFHQQMVYAVAMLTIHNFERALGRLALWSPRRWKEDGRWKSQYVQRLRIYPHALREANAYYSPAKKALLFGYFPAPVGDAREHLPRGTVFACLSHDVVAHETTHALLDGLHRRYIEPSNPDMLAFHEGFADIVAIFQHFTFPEVVRHQIASTRGDLSAENLLAKLAIQFGRATGKHNALRDALGSTDSNGVWHAGRPEPMNVDSVLEPHARGALLVAAVFDAFVSIYKGRTRDLIRIASGGSGILTAGELQPDLVNRLALEATKAAQHVLTMCIRALDYCPPVDITFGGYLRALITADLDLVPNDDLGYRVAFINAFRQRGLYPRDVRSLSLESLRWQAPNKAQEQFLARVMPDIRALRRLMTEWDRPSITGDELDEEQPLPLPPGEPSAPGTARRSSGFAASTDRRAIYYRMRQHAWWLHEFIQSRAEDLDASCVGLDLATPKFEVHSVRPCRRRRPDGQDLLDLVVVITQRKAVYPKSAQNPGEYVDWKDVAPGAEFIFRGGCTLLIDPEVGKVRYCIVKDIRNNDRLERQRRFIQGGAERSALVQELTRPAGEVDAGEPFALVHRAVELEHIND